jgi:hypothetical protein
MWRDPIVGEIHAIREQIARDCDYDLRRIIQSLRTKEKHAPGRVVHKGDLKSSRMGGSSSHEDRKDAA